MEKLTYKKAFDKITEAYIRGEIQPMEGKFCFCGTLAGSGSWISWLHIPEEHSYTAEEYKKMERALMIELKAEPVPGNSWNRFSHKPDAPDYEERLFSGMCAALEVLKEIHKSRGENVEDFQFEKREIKIISD